MTDELLPQRGCECLSYVEHWESSISGACKARLQAAAQTTEDEPLFSTNARICGPCLDGEGEQCHTPGCAFIWLAPPVFAEKPRAHAGGSLRDVLTGGGAFIYLADGAEKPHHQHENCGECCNYAEEPEGSDDCGP